MIITIEFYNPCKNKNQIFKSNFSVNKITLQDPTIIPTSSEVSRTYIDDFMVC